MNSVKATRYNVGPRVSVRKARTYWHFNPHNWALSMLLVVNALLVAWYLFAVNYYAGLSYEQSRLSSQIQKMTSEQQQLLAEVAARSSVAKAQQSIISSGDFVAVGAPKVINLNPSSHQLSLR